jgi:hypothetical protein
MNPDTDHYSAMRKILHAIQRLPQGADRVQFFRLMGAIEAAYTKYNQSLVDNRVRPTIGSQARVDAALASYMALKNDIELSLTLAVLFTGG